MQLEVCGRGGRGGIPLLGEMPKGKRVVLCDWQAEGADRAVALKGLSSEGPEGPLGEAPGSESVPRSPHATTAAHYYFHKSSFGYKIPLIFDIISWGVL